MAQFVKVNTPVEARQHEGPRLTVVSDAKGEQTAEKGDWLLGSERGKITVVKAADFKAQYQPYSPTAADDELAKAKSDLASAQASNADLVSRITALQGNVNDLNAKNSSLSGWDQVAKDLRAELDDAKSALTSEKDAHAALQTQFDALSGVVKAEADAEAKASAAQKKAQNIVGS